MLFRSRVVGYGAAKAAIANFSKYMAGELALKFGKFCAVRSMNKALAGEYIDIL